ncbi:M96 mating-specific protein family [Phytophthora infestans T30-4]|uniref:M96 mating-specific protein family n=2 Tax=Phytophthora infestans TaxID=4787 RepID=D0N4Z6_PHYIT|nr:M96 mating-specific protein family [Phytophthora infestans T30-4]EEY69954.1 M96 mating-specific protein family [Phytophthora infestans T30-4]|eukprot:XP_002998601.1 M96 mating-specific protein family [Phytophthora infestans T30-4]
MELFDRRILPLNLHATGDAWWRRWQNYRGQRSYETANNVIRERCGLEMVDVKTNKSATLYVQQVLRRHVEDRRVVIVWQAYLEPFTFDKERVHGVQLVLKGYVLMKPVESTEGSDVATRVVTCYNITPYFSDPKMRKDSMISALIKFVVSATSANISTSNEAVENLLVDEALRNCY